MAVATLWTITMGSEQSEELSSKAQEMGIKSEKLQSTSHSQKTIRNISVFLPGLINILADLLCGKAITLNSLCCQYSSAFNTS